MELFPGLETNCFTRGDADFGACPRVTADACLARTNIEDPEAPQLDPLTFSERTLERLEDGVDSSLSLVALQTGAFNHLVNDVLFYQGFPPSGEVSVPRLILEMFGAIVNEARVS